MMQEENPQVHHASDDVDPSVPLTPPRRLFAVPEEAGDVGRMFAELDAHLAVARARGPEVAAVVDSLQRAVDRVAELLTGPQGNGEVAS